MKPQIIVFFNMRFKTLKKPSKIKYRIRLYLEKFCEELWENVDFIRKLGWIIMQMCWRFPHSLNRVWVRMCFFHGRVCVWCVESISKVRTPHDPTYCWHHGPPGTKFSSHEAIVGFVHMCAKSTKYLWL